MTASPPTAASLSRRLRDETRELHAAAERSGVMHQLLRGRLSRRGYVALLENLAELYRALEDELRRNRGNRALRRLDLDALWAGMVYVCNPNNPTGTIVRKDEMQRFMDRIPDSVTVVVDEAYSHFVTDPGYESAVRYVREGRNLVVARTFSKIYGLAGMRIGYAIARPDLIARIKPFTVDYTITGAAVNAVIASVADTQHVEKVAKLNAAQRQIFFDEMKKAGFDTTASQSNFVMVNVRTPVAKVIPEFQKRKVLVGREFPALPNFLRVTIGNEDEMKRFYAVFHEIFKA